MFGEVEVRRLAYRARGCENLYLTDAQLNLPAAKHSHGLRRLAALEAPRTSFEDAQTAILLGIAIGLALFLAITLARRYL